jgi:C-terminal processing protease CtpA/Prc
MQSSSSFGGNGGYQIQELEKDSPAAKTNIHNGDYIIEVNRKNIEKQDYQYVQDLINNTYQKDQQIKLLVIDDTGYQWYKTHHQPFESLSSDANITS